MSATKKKKKQEPKDKLVVRDSSGNNVKFSDRLNKAIQDAADVLLNFRDLWEKVKQIAKEEGVDEKDCQREFRQRLRGRLNKDQAYYLFNKEKKKQYSKEQYSRLKNQRENGRNIPTTATDTDVTINEPKQSATKFNPKKFRIYQIADKDRNYLIAALEHFYRKLLNVETNLQNANRRITMFNDMMKDDAQLNKLVKDKVDAEIKRQQSPEYKFFPKNPSALESYVNGLLIAGSLQEKGLL